MSMRLRRPLAAFLGTVSLAGAAASLPVSPARSVPPPADAQCPQIAPITGVTAGPPVHMRTLSPGTTPQPFSRTVLRATTHRVAPGLDQIPVRPTPPPIDPPGGVLAGGRG